MFFSYFCKNELKFFIVSLKKIAELAGVSIGTVDRIIHNRGEVSAQTKAKVEKIIEQIGYKKNIFASNLATNKKFKFAILIPNSKKTEYWKLPFKGIEKAEYELKKFNITLDFYLFNYDKKSFSEKNELLLKKKYDGVVFAPTFHEESHLFINKCYENGMHNIVTIDTQLQAENIPFIGNNAQQTGRIAGKLCSLTTGEKKNFLIIKNSNEIDSTLVYKERIKGFYDYFDENFVFEERKRISINEISIDEEKLIFEPNFFSNVNAIFVPNSRAYIIANYLESHKIKGINIVGYDLLKKNIDFLNSGYIKFLLNQKPDIQGYNAINYLYKNLVLQEKIDKTQYIQTEIIIKESLEIIRKI